MLDGTRREMYEMLAAYLYMVPRTDVWREFRPPSSLQPRSINMYPFNAPDVQVVPLTDFSPSVCTWSLATAHVWTDNVPRATHKLSLAGHTPPSLTYIHRSCILSPEFHRVLMPGTDDVTTASLKLGRFVRSSNPPPPPSPSHHLDSQTTTTRNRAACPQHPHHTDINPPYKAHFRQVPRGKKGIGHARTLKSCSRPPSRRRRHGLARCLLL